MNYTLLSKTSRRLSFVVRWSCHQQPNAKRMLTHNKQPLKGSSVSENQQQVMHMVYMQDMYSKNISHNCSIAQIQLVVHAVIVFMNYNKVILI